MTGRNTDRIEGKQKERKKEEIDRRRKGGIVRNQTRNLLNFPLLLICLFIKRKHRPTKCITTNDISKT